MTKILNDPADASTPVAAQRFARTLTFTLTLTVSILVVVVAAGLILTALPAVTAWDYKILVTMNQVHNSTLSTIALTIDWLFSPRIAVVIVVLAAGIVVLRTRSIRRAAHFAALVGFSWLGSDVIKLVVRRPRPAAEQLPHELIVHAAGFGYPSGHTAFAACLAMAVVVTAGGWRWRPALIALAALVVVTTAASRMYLGVHYLTDVTASLIYSVCAVIALNACWLRFVEPRWLSWRTTRSLAV